jgi:hypothetical protein
MKNYRDGMQVDWMISHHDIREEPYKTEFKDVPSLGDDVHMVVNDPGSQLYVKVKYDNPKNYKVVSLSPRMLTMFHHYGHISMIAIPHPSHSEQAVKNRITRMGLIEKNLEALRCQK